MNLKEKNIKYASLGKWNLLQKLGSGATSRVYLGYDPVARCCAAIKVLKKLEPKYLSIIENEVSIQSSVKHPNILGVQNMYKSVVLTDAEDKVQKVSAVILDFAQGGDVLALIQSIGKFPESLARTYFRQIINALEHLHKNEIAHRDIKPENILLDQYYNIKISDFGCAARYTNRKIFIESAGTSKYFPPEEHTGVYNGAAADLFACGIVLFCMSIGHMPFSKAIEEDSMYGSLWKGKPKSFWKHHENILKEQEDSRLNISSGLKGLLTAMLDPNPAKRPIIEDIKMSSFYKGSTLDKSEIRKLIKSKTTAMD